MGYSCHDSRAVGNLDGLFNLGASPLALQTVHRGHVFTVCPGPAPLQLLSQVFRPEDKGSSYEARLHTQTIFALSQDAP